MEFIFHQMLMVLFDTIYISFSSKLNPKFLLMKYVNKFKLTKFTERFSYKSNSYQLISPELVTIELSSMKRQQDKYPVCPGSSRLTLTFPSRVFRL